VIGLGVMGQMHVLLARQFGAGKVIGADMVRFRLEKAVELGADQVIDVSKEDLASRFLNSRMEQWPRLSLSDRTV